MMGSPKTSNFGAVTADNLEESKNNKFPLKWSHAYKIPEPTVR